MKVVQLTTDNREPFREYSKTMPYFGPAPEALLQGLSTLPELEVHVISCTQRPMNAPEKLSENTWFHLLHVPKIGWLRTGYQGCVRAIRRKLHELRPDIVHGQGTERECALAAAFSGFPNVVTIHGNMIELARLLRPLPGSYLWWAARLERFTLPRARGVFCNSAYTESSVRQRARQTWRVPNALRREFLEIPLPAKRSTARPKLLNIGVISTRKRQVEILELAGRLHREGHSFELQFIGAANPRDRYASVFLQRVKVAEREGFAQYLGTRSLPDLIAVFDGASALVHAPSEEAFGLVVAEGLARNLKVFASNVGGIPAIAAGVECAELFPLEEPAALGVAIARWLSAGSPSPKSAAAEMRLRYHPEIIARRHLEIYRQVLSAI